MTFQNNDALVRNMNSYFISRNDRIARLGMTIDTFQNIPGLVGFWPMSSVQRSTGDAYDLSGQVRTLTYNGNPIYNIYNDIVPYIAFDGAGDFLSRADETDLDISGLETIYNSAIRGITFGGWFRNAAGTPTNDRLFMKGHTSDQRSYSLDAPGPAGRVQLRLSNSGTTDEIVLVNDNFSFSIWHFVVGRWFTGAVTSLFVDDTKTTIGTVIASLFNTNIGLGVGAMGNGGQTWNGDASFCFLSANALSDAYINALYQQSRVLFGV